MQAGPRVVVGYLTKEFILGVFPQQWFSLGGARSQGEGRQWRRRRMVSRSSSRMNGPRTQGRDTTTEGGHRP